MVELEKVREDGVRSFTATPACFPVSHALAYISDKIYF